MNEISAREKGEAYFYSQDNWDALFGGINNLKFASQFIRNSSIELTWYLKFTKAFPLTDQANVYNWNFCRPKIHKKYSHQTITNSYTKFQTTRIPLKRKLLQKDLRPLCIWTIIDLSLNL